MLRLCGQRESFVMPDKYHRRMPQQIEEQTLERNLVLICLVGLCSAGRMRSPVWMEKRDGMGPLNCGRGKAPSLELNA